jgi:hypothetical protein
MIGFLGLFTMLSCHVITRLGFELTTEIIRFPLGKLDSINSTDEGDLITYTGTLHRLQIFSKDGKYIRGWFVNTTFNNANIYMCEQGLINIVSPRGACITYNKIGGLVKKTPPPKDFVRSDYNTCINTQSGSTIKFENGFFRTRLFEQRANGEINEIIRDKIYWCPFRAEYSIMTFFFPPSVIILISRIREDKKSKNASKESLNKSNQLDT